MLAERKMAHWEQVIRECEESGMTIKAYCENADIRPSLYFYWRRKLRNVAGKIDEGTLPAPQGWIKIEPASPDNTAAQTIPIEIGKCRIIASGETDEALLSKVCKVLVTL